MAFSEDLKLQVKKKAMFKCCRCQAIGVEVHHINPQHENGEDNLANAAPLCPNCHTWFGDNPLKKKEIKQMRDNWYEIVERMYAGQATQLIPLVEKIDQSLEEVKSRQADISEIKQMLKEVSNRAIDNMTLGTVALTASNVVMASGASLSNIKMEELSVLRLCKRCSMFVAVSPRQSLCPTCGSMLEN